MFANVLPELRARICPNTRAIALCSQPQPRRTKAAKGKAQQMTTRDMRICTKLPATNRRDPNLWRPETPDRDRASGLTQPINASHKGAAVNSPQFSVQLSSQRFRNIKTSSQHWPIDNMRDGRQFFEPSSAGATLACGRRFLSQCLLSPRGLCRRRAQLPTCISHCRLVVRNGLPFQSEKIAARGMWIAEIV